MKLYPSRFTRAVTMVHGKSEAEIVRQVRRLHIKMELYENTNHGITIESLSNTLVNRELINKDAFRRKYSKDYSEINFEDFTFFIIMDKDSASDELLSNYLDKSMFRNHWLYPYIIPIINNPRLEIVLMKSGLIKKEPRNDEKVETVRYLFNNPSKWTDTSDNIQIVKNLSQRIKAVDGSNLNEFFDFCVDWAQNRG